MKILILGGYGAVGYQTAKILLHRTDAEIVLAGRSMDKAHTAAEELGRGADSARVSAMSLDAFNFDHVLAAFRTVDWVIVCIPLVGLGAKLARAAFEAGINYIDINADHEKREYLQSAVADINKKGLVFVSEAGMGPGVPSLLVRYAHEQLGELATVEIGSIFRESKISRGSVSDLLVALGEKHRVFRDGAWQRAGVSEAKEIDFGPSYGKHRCYPFEFLELVTLPAEELGLDCLGFYSAGVNPFLDLQVWVWMVTGLYKYQFGIRLGTRLAMWLQRFTRPPFCTVIQANASARDGRRICARIGYENAYVATAIPLAACVLQILESDLSSKRGLHLMGQFLETNRFLDDIESMGMDVSVDREPSAQQQNSHDADFVSVGA